MISTAQHATAETVRADELAGRAPGNAWPAQRRKGPAQAGRASCLGLAILLLLRIILAT